MPETSFFVIACVAALLVGMSKGGLPGVGILAVPTMALLISPVKAAALLLPLYVLTDVVSIYLYRRHFSAANLRILIPAGVLGVLVGWGFAAYLSDRAVSALVGLLGLGFCLNTWFKRNRVLAAQPVHVGKGLFWGTFAGFTSFVSHAGGPPYQIYILPQKLEKKVFAGTTTFLFAVMNLAKVGPYALLSPFDAQDLQVVAWLVPAALLGTGAGAYLTHRLDDQRFFRLVQIALFVISLRLLFKAL
jgi:uncharacterized membrane protein YfcA